MFFYPGCHTLYLVVIQAQHLENENGDIRRQPIPIQFNPIVQYIANKSDSRISVYVTLSDEYTNLNYTTLSELSVLIDWRPGAHPEVRQVNETSKVCQIVVFKVDATKIFEWLSISKINGSEGKLRQIQLSYVGEHRMPDSLSNKVSGESATEHLTSVCQLTVLLNEINTRVRKSLKHQNMSYNYQTINVKHFHQA